ncbi:MAG TPA: transcriptional regulator [Chloroflexi bacterium]|nr:transcriptional regulator [Chloroflexota bacterium]
MTETTVHTEERLRLRKRIIGVLLRNARERANKTKQECADALGVSPDLIADYEAGEAEISLPELETLAFLFNCPPDHFWRQDADLIPEPDSPPISDVLTLRHRIVGALLRQARLEAGKTQKELAALIGRSDKVISDYEYGERPIPIVELELLAQALHIPIEHFLDAQRGPLGRIHREREINRRFEQLPIEIREFVTHPLNVKYLEVAMRLAEMEVDRLRSIAEGLLDITY